MNVCGMGEIVLFINNNIDIIYLNEVDWYFGISHVWPYMFILSANLKKNFNFVSFFILNIIILHFFTYEIQNLKKIKNLTNNFWNYYYFWETLNLGFIFDLLDRY